MDTTLRDIRYACRQFLRARGFFATAVLTLAIGIGANTALFSYISAAFLQPMPGVADASRLVWVSWVNVAVQRPVRMSLPEFEDFRTGTTAFEGMAVVLNQTFALSNGGEPEQVRGEAVSGNYFAVLRTPIALGRGLTEADVAPGAAAVTVVSHDLWRRRLEADPAAIGRTIHINRIPHVIVGVAPEGFTGAERDSPRSVWVTTSGLAALFPAWKTVAGRDTRIFSAVGRLAPGATRTQADAELATIAARVADPQATDASRMTARTFDASSGLPPGAGRQVLPVAAVGLGVTGLILLIACANVSNLLLARGLSRRRELGVRLALGAARGRIVRQLLTESLLLAGVAAGLGLLVALWTGDLIRASVPDLPIAASVDVRVVAFSIVAAAVVAVGTGLLPAFAATRQHTGDALNRSLQNTDPRRSRLQSAFVTAQVALSVVLLVAAGLFLRSLEKANRIDMGFDTSRRVLAASFDVGLQPGGAAGSRAVVDRIVEAAAALPGVTNVSLTSAMPAAEWVSEMIEVPGDQTRRLRVTEFAVRPGFFETIGLPLTRGRDFTSADAPGAAPVVIVNEALARRAWGDADPIGRQLRTTGDAPVSLTVVGVAANSTVADIESGDLPALYQPHLQDASMSRATLLVRTDDDAGSLQQPLRAVIRSVDPHLPVVRLQTLDRYRQQATGGRRVAAGLLGGFGLLGLALAAVGVAGAMSVRVTQRTREIGVRLALGADPQQVVRELVRHGMRLTLIGLAIGTALAFAATRLISSMLFGITASDSVAYLGVAAGLLVVAAAACWVPARRAAGVDPLRALAVE